MHLIISINYNEVSEYYLGVTLGFLWSLEHFKYPSDTNTPLPHQAQPSKVQPSLVTHNFSVIPKVTQAISYNAYGNKIWLRKV
jgi:hypothetical protein